MNRLERTVGEVLLLVGLVIFTALCIRQYSAARYQAGYDAAVADGKEARDSTAAAALAIDSDLRAKLLECDTTALRKEQEHATNFEAAQRRARWH